MKNNNFVISTDKAPAAVGPYSQAVVKGDYVFISGQLPINPETNKIEKFTSREQAKQSMENIKSILKECNLTTNDLVKTTIFVTDLNCFSEVNEEYAKFFSDYSPARACVEVKKLPKDALVEIEAIAYIE